MYRQAGGLSLIDERGVVRRLVADLEPLSTAAVRVAIADPAEPRVASRRPRRPVPASATAPAPRSARPPRYRHSSCRAAHRVPASAPPRQPQPSRDRPGRRVTVTHRAAHRVPASAPPRPGNRGRSRTAIDPGAGPANSLRRAVRSFSGWGPDAGFCPVAQKPAMHHQRLRFAVRRSIQLGHLAPRVPASAPQPQPLPAPRSVRPLASGVRIVREGATMLMALDAHTIRRHGFASSPAST
jgi:hypothetical protein